MSGPTLLILAGQSNMAGRGKRADLPLLLQTLPPQVRLFDADDPGEKTTTFGPEIGLAHTLADRCPNHPFTLIKLAQGGTSLLAWSAQWSAEQASLTDNANAGPLYQRLLDAVKEVRTPGTSIGALFWMQGERDARYPEVGQQYAERFINWVKTLRADLKVPDLPVIYGLINPPIDGWPAREAVRAAQQEATRHLPGLHLVRIDDLPMWDDRLHLNSAGQVTLGERFARQYFEVAKPCGMAMVGT
jgi:hypothetical protein